MFQFNTLVDDKSIEAKDVLLLFVFPVTKIEFGI